MADEAIVTIVARMQDEASGKMKALGQATEQTHRQALDLRMGVTALGSSLAATGSLMSQIGGESLKTASTFLIMGGALMSSISAIQSFLPFLRSLISTLRSLAVVQAIVSAFQGPWGWAKIAAGTAIAGAAVAGIYALTGGFGGGGGGGGGATIGQVNINAQAFTGSRADARKFGSQIRQETQNELRIGR